MKKKTQKSEADKATDTTKMESTDAQASAFSPVENPNIRENPIFDSPRGKKQTPRDIADLGGMLGGNPTEMDNSSESEDDDPVPRNNPIFDSPRGKKQ